MHSRIFQIESETVSKNDRICADTILKCLTGTIADYEVDIEDKYREKEIDWLMSTNFGKVCRRDGDKITLGIDVGAFFDDDYKQFKDTVNKLSKIKFNQFISNHSNLKSLVSQLRASYNYGYGLYVWHCDELYTMQSWMRQAEPLGVYYFGGVVDCHF